MGCLSESVHPEDALRRHALFAHWPAGVLQRLLSISHLKSYPQGAWIHDNAQEQPEILIMVSGYLQICRYTTDQRLQAICLVGSERIVCLAYDLASSCGLPIGCWAHSDALVIHVRKQCLARLLDAEPELWRLLGVALLSQQRELLEALVEQTRGGAAQRIASLLYRYSRSPDVSLPCGGQVPQKVPLSQAQLADFLQLSRQTVNEVLRWFSSEGWISIGYRSIAVLDPAALLEHSRGRLTADMPRSCQSMALPSDSPDLLCMQPMP